MTRRMQLLTTLALWLLAVVAHAGTVTYVYTDPQGTPLAEADASGTITARFDYAPYGQSVTSMGAAPNGPGYTGHVNDPDTGLVYMQARYYDPEVGRFLSVDPVRPSAGGVFDFNRFAYVNNNPVINIDPTGMHTASEGDGFSGSDCAIYHCETMFDGGDGGGGSNTLSNANVGTPKGTPKSMEKYFQSKDVTSQMKAALAVMDYYGIDYSGIKCCAYVTFDVNAQMNPNGELDIGKGLFSNSFGMIGAILYHEVGVHWQVQYTKSAVIDGAYTQAWFMREVQAYDYETSAGSIRRFGLTPTEVGGERAKRGFNFKYLTPANKVLVNEGVYVPQSKAW